MRIEGPKSRASLKVRSSQLTKCVREYGQCIRHKFVLVKAGAMRQLPPLKYRTSSLWLTDSNVTSVAHVAIQRVIG